MLSTYNDAYLLNESLAYCLSTNYFRNPAFAGLQEEEEDSQCSPLSSSDQNHGSVGKNLEKTSGETDGINGTPEQCSIQSTSKRTNKQKIQCQSFRGKRRRFNEFCDNLALTFKGKLFVMELNFKRRLGLMRKYLNRTMPWILPSKANEPQARTVAKEMVNQFGERQANNDNEGSVFNSNYDEHQSKKPYAFGNRKVARENYHLDHKSFWANLRPPKSSECLGEQQVKILNRLAQIKMVSKNLFSDRLEDEEEEESDCDSSDMETNQAFMSSSGFVGELNLSGSETFGPSIGALPSQAGTPFVGSGFSNGIYNENMVESHSECSFNSQYRSLFGSQTFTMDGGSRLMTRSVTSGDASAYVGIEKGTETRHKITGKQTPSSSSKSSSRAFSKRKNILISSGKELKNAAYALAKTKPRKLCIVCYENRPNIVTLPCKHHDTCSDCFIEIIYMSVKHRQYPLKCVLCRQKIERIRCSRRLLLSVIEKNRAIK